MRPRSYDSEEERYKARQQAAQRGAAVRATASAAADLLGAYRARQQARRELEDGALRAKLEQQQGRHAGEWQTGDGWPDHSRLSGDDGGEARSRGWVRLVQQHEQCWQALEQRMPAASAEPAARQPCGSSSPSSTNTSGRLAFCDVPWPPLDSAAYLQGLIALQQQQQQRAVGQQRDEVRRAARRAYAHACLRWHPDKFVARWGPLLEDSDREAILHQVHELLQSINEAWGAKQREWATQPAATAAAAES
ncbi:hypothetical protein D9Q98_009386 [Chlorella vulgaris]|uniref:J domain-containing protein n=1 Tax=Chlorella vulgaris TaxID=3077 RepID=A0A9D4TPL2_CHLVU|nr:hypothetical protein D9Q98_009386 [Chlorella vulgaris]